MTKNDITPLSTITNSKSPLAEEEKEATSHKEYREAVMREGPGIPVFLLDLRTHHLLNLPAL